MSRNAYRGPTLPRVLLDQVQDGNKFKNKAANVSRKDRRKAQRQQKRAVRSTRRFPARGDHGRPNGNFEDDDGLSEKEVNVSTPKPVPQQALKEIKPLKSILKKTAQRKESEIDSEGSAESDPPPVSRSIKNKLAEDDAEIEALEKKLKIKGKKSKAFESDELDWLVDGSEGDSDGDSYDNLKRKRPEDTKWLRDKRSKFNAPDGSVESDEIDVASSMSDMSIDGDHESDLNDNDLREGTLEVEESHDFEEFNSEDSEDSGQDQTPRPLKRARENPYVAPVSKDTIPAAKYIPPSLRKASTSDEEVLKQLRRQVQGLLNRLSEANMLSILQSLEELYLKNARQHVTSTLVDLLEGLISNSSTLNDTFLILHAGFAAVVYKVVGTDFGAHLLEKLVESFDHHRKSIATEGKQNLNLLAYVACLYTFQVVGSGLIFDYIRILLEQLSETNTELLLRVIRTAGQQLRQDDPSSLKDIVVLLQRSVTNIGEDKLSVRTKFMIETINDLKNNRMKSGAAGLTIAAEHVARMKKILGSLNNSRSVKATEPLRVTLSDIQDSEKKGKWWLVGASYLDSLKHSVNGETGMVQKAKEMAEDTGYESETPGSVNLHKLARTQGMNTDVRRAIFVTILSSSDHEEAHMRLLKLHLKAKQMLEIPRVLVHCCGAEQTYNPYYAVLARHFCGDHKLRKAFQFTLWDAFKVMNGEEEEEEEGNEKMSMRKLVNLAKMYGNLVASGGLDIRILKKLDFSYLEDQASIFAEVLFTTLFVQLRKDSAKNFKKAVRDVSTRTAGVEGLSQGLVLFLESKLANTELANGKKEKNAVEEGRVYAMEVLTEAATAAPLTEDSEDDGDS